MADDGLAEELAAELASALAAVATLRMAVVYLASRPGPVEAERALLRVAVRHAPAGPLPLTRGRRLVWDAWCGLGTEAPARARWRALVASLDELRREGHPLAAEAYHEATLASHPREAF